MKPMAGMAKFAISAAYLFSPIQKNLFFGTFNDELVVTEMPLEQAKDMANFINIPDFTDLLTEKDKE